MMLGFRKDSQISAMFISIVSLSDSYSARASDIDIGDGEDQQNCQYDRQESS